MKKFIKGDLVRNPWSKREGKIQKFQNTKDGLYLLLEGDTEPLADGNIDYWQKVENTKSSKKFKFLTNFRKNDGTFEKYKKAAETTNKELGYEAISISKTDREKSDENGSIWYCCNDKELQIFHVNSENIETYGYLD